MRGALVDAGRDLVEVFLHVLLERPTLHLGEAIDLLLQLAQLPERVVVVFEKRLVAVSPEAWAQE